MAAPANNDRRCYICNDPNHLANACTQKGKHKQHAQSKLKANRSFMALFQASFPKPEDKKCAQRMIDAGTKTISVLLALNHASLHVSAILMT